jgi:hypothetical protein
MQLRPGQKLHSTVSEAQVVVVKAPAGDVDLACGGAPMVEDAGAAGSGGAVDASLGDGPQLGKRYADEELGLELLCSKAGDGALTVGGQALPMKGAKPLPSSD